MPIKCLRSEHEYSIRINKNELGLCCKSSVVADPTNIDNLLSDLQNGVKNPACRVCWDAEDAGTTSWREIGNNEYTVNPNTILLELLLDNTCDSACVYCSPDSSSKWDQEYRSNNQKVILPWIHNLHPFSGNTEKLESHIQQYVGKMSLMAAESNKNFSINLQGGEPLLSKFVRNGGISELVKLFYANNNTRKLSISIISNGNTPSTLLKKVQQELNELSLTYAHVKFTIMLSMEAIGENAEYIRYGVSWNKFMINVNSWATMKNIRIVFLMTISPFSIKDTAEFIKQMHTICQSYSKIPKFSISKVYEPACMNIAILDNTFLHYLTEAIDFLNEYSHSISDSSGSVDRLIQLKNDIGKTNDAPLLGTYFKYFLSNRAVDIRSINPELFEFITSRK